MADIFVSFSRDDASEAQQARQLHELLSHRYGNVVSLVARRSDLASWVAHLPETLGARIVVVLFSSRTVGPLEPHVRALREEISRRSDRVADVIIPVRLDDAFFEPLAAVVHVDLFPDWTAGVTNLVRAIDMHVDRGPARSVLDEDDKATFRDLLGRLRENPEVSDRFNTFEFSARTVEELTAELARFREFRSLLVDGIDISIYIDTDDEGAMGAIARNVEMLAVELGYGQPISTLVG